MADHERGASDEDALEEKDEWQHSDAAMVRGFDWHEPPMEIDDHDEPRSPTKLGLAFILNQQRRGRPWGSGQWEHDDDAPLVPPLVVAAQATNAVASHGIPPAESPLGHDRNAPRRRQRSASTGVAAVPPVRSPRSHSASDVSAIISRRQGRMCKAEGCTNYIVHKGLCCRHGGGKKCSVEGCESSAKHGGRCWKHGGSVNCKIEGCTRKAKARGLCWGHGGGAKCQADACTKVAISNGLCWAHGGGKRCIFDGCQRPAYERTHSFCLQHYEGLQGVDYYEV